MMSFKTWGWDFSLSQKPRCWSCPHLWVTFTMWAGASSLMRIMMTLSWTYESSQVKEGLIQQYIIISSTVSIDFFMDEDQRAFVLTLNIAATQAEAGFLPLKWLLTLIQLVFKPTAKLSPSNSACWAQALPWTFSHCTN